MKLETFRKKTLVETGIIAAIVLVASGIIYFLGSVSDDYEQQNNSMKAQVDSIATDMKNLKTKYYNIKQNIGLYEEIQKKQSLGQLTITRQAMMDKFNLFRSQILLMNMRLSMSSIQEMGEAQFRRKTNAVNWSEVTVGMDALSDEHIYGLIKTIQENLPGISAISRLSIAKTGSLSETTLRAVSEKGPVPLVKADMKFVWFGINPVEAAEGTATNAPKKPRK